LVDFQDFKALAAFGDNVQLAILVPLGYRHDLGGAPDVRKTFFFRPDDAERLFLLQTLRHEFLVTRFEDMERQGSAGKEHYIQRKKRQQRLQLELRPNLRQSDCTPRLDLRSAAE